MSVRSVPLEEVCEINPSTAFNLRDDSPCTFVPMEAVDDWSAQIVKLATRPFREVSKGYTSFAENDVLLAKITPCMENGKCAIARGLRDRVGFGSTEFHVLRASKHVLPEWLLYFWRLPETRRNAERSMTGTAGQKRVPSSHLKQIRIPMPDLPAQKRIAKELEQADRVRRGRRHALELSDTFLPAAFREIFGDPVKNSRGWPCVPISEVGDVQGGLQLSAKRNFLPLKKPFLRVANVQRGFLDLSEVKIIGLTKAEFHRTLLKKNDLLLVEGNGNPSEVGRAAQWNGSIQECVHQNHLIRVRCTEGAILPEFLLALLNGTHGMDYYLKHGHTTSGLVTISTGLVNDFPALLPPIKLQQHFAALVEQHKHLQVEEREALRQAEHLFQSLLHRSFTNDQSTELEPQLV